MPRIVLNILCLALLSTSSAIASEAPKSQHIIGGNTDNYWRSAVALMNDKGQLVCSGVVIGHNLVLTAAHCIKANIRFVRDGYNVYQSNEWKVVETSVHEEYLGLAQGVDLALLRVATDEYILPVSMSLPKNSDWSSFGDVQVVGYGKTLGQGEEGTQRSRATGTKLVSEKRFFHGESSCFGDSGGPVLDSTGEEEFLIGIVSSGSPDCRGDSSAIRVAAHLPWIQEGIRSAAANGCLEGSQECHQVVSGCSLSSSENQKTNYALWLFLLLFLSKKTKSQSLHDR